MNIDGMNIGGVEIGAGNRCRFVAEVSNNHNGSLQRAFRLIDAAKAVGADFAKLQCYSPYELLGLRGGGMAPEPWGSAGWTMQALYEKAQTPLEWFPRLADYCASIGMPWFSSVFGEQSLAVLESCGCPAYKIALIDSHDKRLRDLVYATRKPSIISTAEQYLSGLMPTAVLFCPVGYPTAAEDVHLPQFGHRKAGSAYLGLSSHCMDPLLPVAAVARGCALIEMHMQLDDEPSELEANVSLTASQFRQMIADVRRVEGLLA